MKYNIKDKMKEKIKAIRKCLFVIWEKLRVFFQKFFNTAFGKKIRSIIDWLLDKKRIKWTLPFIFVAFTFLGYLILIVLQEGPITRPAKVKIPPIVDVYSVQFYNKPIELQFTGNIAPLYKTTIFSEVTGKVIYLSPKLVKGGFFKKGERMLQIDSRDYKDELAQAKAALSKVRIDFAKEKELSRQALEDWKELGTGKPTDLALRKPQTQQVLLAFEAAKSRVQKAKRNIEKTTIKAQFNCMVASRTISPGTFVPTGSSLFTIYHTDIAEVRIALSHEDAKLLDLPAPGVLFDKTKKAEITVYGKDLSAKRYGYIARIEGETDLETRFQHLVVRIDDPYSLENTDESIEPVLKIGDFVEITVFGKVLDRCIRIPEYALLHNNKVIKVDKEEKIVFEKVKIIKRLKDTVLITGNFEENDKIVLSKIEFPVEGTKVRINGKDSE